jgi:hypothetical protein
MKSESKTVALGDTSSGDVFGRLAKPWGTSSSIRPSEIIRNRLFVLKGYQNYKVQERQGNIQPPQAKGG